MGTVGLQEQGPVEQQLARWAALLIVAAGVIHIVIAPEHWGHAPAHGLFFVLSGVAEIVWGILVWRRPSQRLINIGLVGAGALLVLWGISRVLPAPFGHGPEEVDAMGVACKIAEALGMAVLALIAFQAAVYHEGRKAAWRVVSLLVAGAVLTGLLTYGAARAAEPLFPGLKAVEEHHDEAGPGGMEDMHMPQDETTTAP